jgi:hypothetical protein
MEWGSRLAVWATGAKLETKKNAAARKTLGTMDRNYKDRNYKSLGHRPRGPLRKRQSAVASVVFFWKRLPALALEVTGYHRSLLGTKVVLIIFERHPIQRGIQDLHA